MRALRKRGKALGVVAALVGLIVFAAVALADTIIGDADSTTNTVAADIQSSISLGANQSKSARFGLLVDDNATDTLNGCNTQTSAPVTLRVTSNKSWVTVSATGTVGTYGSSADIVVNGCDTGSGLADGLQNGSLLHYKTGAVVPSGEQATVTAAYLSGGRDADRDATNGFQAASFTSGSFTVNGASSNVAPTVAVTGDDTADEGDTKTYGYTVTDPDDTPTVTTSCGDYGTKSNEDSDSFDCTFPDGPNTSTVSVSADDGDASDSDSITVNVANVAPVAVLSGDGSADEGETVNYTYSASDVGDDTLSIATSCGSNATQSNDDGDSFDCTFTDGPGTSDVSVTATETDGDAVNDSDTETITVNVANVDPLVGDLTLTNGTGTACLAGNTVKLDFGFTDAGVNDSPWAVNIDWGDGSTDTAYNATSQDAQPQQSHTYSGAGSHQIVVTVTDKDTGAGQSDTTDGNVSFLYNMTGILAPFNADGSSVWKYGSTLPVKVRITDCNGTPVSNLRPQVGTSMLSTLTPADGISETASTSAADSTGAMRYSDGQYIYNFASKNLADGNATYYMYVRGKDAGGAIVTTPTQVSQRFGLKTK